MRIKHLPNIVDTNKSAEREGKTAIDFGYSYARNEIGTMYNMLLAFSLFLA